MNLEALRDFVGSLLDYDPTNSTYTDQLTNLLNDVQTRILTDKQWDFSKREIDLTALADTTLPATGFVNGSATVTGVFPVSIDAVRPGSALDLGILSVTDSAGETASYQIAYVETANTLYLDRDFTGVTGAYTATVQFREVLMPVDSMTVLGVLDPTVGATPKPLTHMGKYARDIGRFDPTQTGDPESYIPSQGIGIPAPRTAGGVAVAVGAPGKGERTINVYMVNVRDPGHEGFDTYRADVSGGLESGLSAATILVLADTDEITVTPETLPDSTGLYRRYYFTCPDLGVIAPVRLRDAGSSVDTVNAKGTVTLTADTSVTTLSSQAFQSRAVRYCDGNGVYRSFLLFPHPSANQAIRLRRIIAPRKMREPQDVPLVPEAYASILAYAALEDQAPKVGALALLEVYRRKKEDTFRAMQARYLSAIPRRIVKGTGVDAAYPDPFGPLVFTP